MNYKIFSIIPIVLIFTVVISSQSINAAKHQSSFGNNSVTFVGETREWYVEHKMEESGGEIKYNTKITYKGNDDEKLNVSPLYYEVVDPNGGSHGGCFNLKKSNVFKGEAVSCGGCHFLVNEIDILCVIHYANFSKEDLVSLKRMSF